MQKIDPLSSLSQAAQRFWDALQPMLPKADTLARAEQSLLNVRPPDWLVKEALNRVLLTLNHVLAQEPEAMARLKRQQGQVIALRWRDHQWHVQSTGVGLLEWVEPECVLVQEGAEQIRVPAKAPALSITLTENSLWVLGQAVMQGQKPPVHIEGDVQLAAEVNWLIDHVRWDVEEDLSRLIGDGPARAIAQVGRKAIEGLRTFVGKARERSGSAS